MFIGREEEEEEKEEEEKEEGGERSVALTNRAWHRSGWTKNQEERKKKQTVVASWRFEKKTKEKKKEKKKKRNTKHVSHENQSINNQSDVETGSSAVQCNVYLVQCPEHRVGHVILHHNGWYENLIKIHRIGPNGLVDGIAAFASLRRCRCCRLPCLRRRRGRLLSIVSTIAIIESLISDERFYWIPRIIGALITTA